MLCVLVDSTPPQVRVNPDKAVYNIPNPSFTWTSSEDATFECAIDDTRLYKNCGQGTSGLFTEKNIPSGRHIFYIRGRDKTNNVGPNVEYPFEIGVYNNLVARACCPFVERQGPISSGRNESSLKFDWLKKIEVSISEVSVFLSLDKRTAGSWNEICVMCS